MRRILLAAMVALPALSLAGPARAQSPDFAFRLGWSRSGFGGHPVVERMALNGLSAAAALTVHVTPALALQPELLLVRKGAVQASSFIGVANGDTTVSRTTSPLDLFYAELPVLARLTLPTGRGGIRPYLAAGPYVAHLLHCTSNLTPVATLLAAPRAAVADTVSVGEACLDGGVRRDDVGAVAAAGFRWPLGSRLSAVLDARYEWGWRSVVNGESDVHNRSFGLTAGLSLPLGR